MCDGEKEKNRWEELREKKSARPECGGSGEEKGVVKKVRFDTSD